MCGSVENDVDQIRHEDTTALFVWSRILPTCPVMMGDLRSVVGNGDEEWICSHLGPLPPSLPPNLDVDEDHEEDGKDEEECDMNEGVDGPPERV